MITKKDVVIIGAGAAGLFCAIEAGKRGRNVVVLDHADRIGKKIAISGGGRCNFTNIHSAPDNFLSDNPHFAKSALARYTPFDFIQLIENHRIAFHEKKLGQLFCNEGSQQIIDMLLRECADAGVEIICRAEVKQVLKNELFEVRAGKLEFVAPSLVVATGGLSIPTLGATDFGYQLARQFGLKIVEPRPALVPFVVAPRLHLNELSGISIDALVSCNGKSFRENILITHRGLSGPAILQISSYWQPGKAVTINLLPDVNASDLMCEQKNQEVELVNYLSRLLPRRFITAWCDLQGLSSKPLKQYSQSELIAIGKQLNDWIVQPTGTEGYRKAEVTAGGVSTDELSSQSMEAKRISGLYFIGEVTDVTGELGGHNFQWAWASGYAAGQYV